MKNGSMVTWFFPRMKVTTIAEIHSIQITYLILFLQPCFADLSLHLATHSCSPPAGQRYPQKARPKNTEKISKLIKTIKLPFMICSDAAMIIRYGEKYHAVIGNSRNDMKIIVLLIV
jgi:hypothetical protein